MGKRRSKLEVTLTMLKAINDGIEKPTRIMYTANMSWKPTQKTLADMVAKGFITETVTSGKKRPIRRFTITKKGKALIKYYDGMKDLVGDVI